MGFAADLQAELDGQLAATGATGAATVVIADGEVHVATGGVTNVEHPDPITADTLFQVASNTKTFTSAAVMLLVEEGSVSLDDPLSKHFPELVQRGGLELDAITVEHVLSHQAGFDGDHLFVHRTADLQSLHDARRLFEPGTGMSYSNAGFTLAGEIVARTSGMPFAVFVRQRILDPLGMRSASFTADEAITFPVAAPHWVIDGTSYVLRNGGWQPGWELEPHDHAAAGLALSALQLAEWGRFQLTGTTTDGNRLLSDQSLDRLHTPVGRLDGVEQVALDWFVVTSDGHPAWSHGGVTVGYCSDLTVAPDSGVVVATVTNATNGGWVHEHLRRWTLATVADHHERDPEPDPSIQPDVSVLEGRYVHSFSYLDVTAGPEPGQVTVTPVERKIEGAWLPPVDSIRTLAFFGDHDAVSIGHAGPKRVVRFDPDGQWLTWGSRRPTREP